MNNNEKIVIDMLRRRMETHPDEPMHYYEKLYTPAEMIDEIKRETEAGKSLVKQRLSGYTWQ